MRRTPNTCSCSSASAKAKSACTGRLTRRGRKARPLLVQIRESLVQLKLVRQSGVTMFEDHLAAVFETMRVLITGLGQPSAYAVDVQREFFAAISIRG